MRTAADIVLGGGDAPLHPAFEGWLVRARCMVLALDRGAVARWGWAARGAWSTLDAWGLIEDAEGTAMRKDPLGLDPAQIALWPEGEPAPVPDAAHPDTEVLERTCERALAWHRGRALRPGVFVDRDGTLVIERGYLSDPEELELLPGAARALHDLKAAGLPIVVVSNQSGVGRGFFPLSRVYEAMARLRVQLRAAGVELDGIYFCPHGPEEGCSCRKPGTALLERAAEDHLLQLPASFMVGDKLLDVDTAHRVRARGVLVRSGYGREEETRAGEQEAGAVPDFVCDDLGAAAAWILAKEGAGEPG
jgi:D-glycero-D-manno-heptose 1,7-bisphosphate phosphatase